jgi:calcium-dependent protein kinase
MPEHKAGILLSITFVLCTCGPPVYQLVFMKMQPSKVHMGMQGSFDLDEESWGGISLEAKQLIKRLLSVDPLCRPSATEVCLA